jgi:glycosyltransferase involved in cell wall biosynthesis
VRVVLSNSSAKWGGVHAVTEFLARGLQARGHEVIVYCRPDSKLEARIRPIARCRPILRGMDLSPAALLRCSKALRQDAPDVVLTLMKKDVRLTAPAARLMGVPVVVRHPAEQPLRNNPYTRILYGVIPTHHVTNAQATRQTLLRSAPWLKPEDITVIYNGVDLDAFDHAEAAALTTSPDAIRICYLGGFESRKGLVDLIAAWPEVAARVPNAHLLLVGRGPLEATLREQIQPLPRVIMVGYRSDVPAVLKAIDLLVLPSYWEGAPNVVLEAMAAGKPVVATAVSGTPELVDHGRTGLLVPPHASAALAQALIELAADPAARARMGAAGREKAKTQFSVEAMVDHYVELLARVAGVQVG